MGLFDIPAPLLTAVDNALDFLPPLLRLLLWALVTGVLSMVAYWACSAQGKVATAKATALNARVALSSYEGHEFSELWPLIGESLSASGRHFLVVLGPALLGSLPALFVIVWVSNQFGYSLPPGGAAVQITATPAMKLETAPAGGSQMIWPATGETTTVRTTSGVPLVELPLPAAVPVIHKKLWWNTLIGNRAGYLADDAPVEQLQVDLEPQRFVTLGPGWLQTWEAPYFLVLILSSLAIKFVFKID